jgi:hypothetical protein
MSRARLGLQTTLVLTAIALVSWPEFRSARSASVWRYTPEAVYAMEANDLTQYQYADDTRAGRVGTGRARFSGSPDGTVVGGAGGRTEGNTTRPVFLPLEVLEAGGTINAVMGRARTSLNTPIPYARVLLRNIRTGAIEARATANEEGRYTFIDVDASAYVVELIGSDGSVIAASEMVALAAGDVRETTVRVSANALATAAAFGGRLTGVLAESPTAGNNPLSQDGITRTADTLRQLANVSPQR